MANLNQELVKNLNGICNANYSERAARYEEEIKLINRRGCDVLANLLNIFIDKKDSKILDIAAGTGLASISLRKHGYNNLDGLDPCVEMLNLAKERNLYNDYFYEGLYKDKQTSLPDESYDVLICVASMDEEALIKFECYEEFSRLLRKNGYAFIVDRDAFYQKDKHVCDKVLSDLESAGICQTIINCSFENYIKNDLKSLDGRIIIFKKI